MPQRQNLKPALADTLRALRNDVQSGATVPHGVKTVQPGEGLQLVPPEGGAEIFWDWETANSVEQRIHDGTALIDQTRATLAQTEQELQSAQDRIGRVAAGEIEKIDGHIILNGTVDLPALNVTGEMAATVVKALDVTARRGIFTEGLTAQDATLLGTTVAETINAGAVATRIMTSGLLQTTTAANRGVKIDNAGIRAWNDSGQQTIRLNGADNLVQGTFQTGTTGARIKIDAVDTTAFMDLYGNSGGLDHGTIYYDAAVPGKTDAALTLTAIKDYSTNPENPSFRLFPTRGTFAFQGRWASETDPTKFMVIQNNAGLPANAYNTFKIAYSTPFPTKSAIRFPLISIESENGADVMATIVAQTEKDITINAINKSGGKASGRIILKVVTFNTDNTQAR